MPRENVITEVDNDPPKPKFPDDRVEPTDTPLWIQNLVGWMIYSVFMFALLAPFHYTSDKLTTGEWINGALILGWHFSLLNKILFKK